MEQSSTENGIPSQLLMAIGLVESGRTVDKKRIAWPWTVNANGQGSTFATKQEAIDAVLKLRQKGITSIDVGCMQINLKHHPYAFRNLEEAFDPQMNVNYAARFLSQLFQKWKSWGHAVARYHSTGSSGFAYLQRVLHVWGQPHALGRLRSSTPSTRVVRKIIVLK